MLISDGTDESAVETLAVGAEGLQIVWEIRQWQLEDKLEREVLITDVS